MDSTTTEIRYRHWMQIMQDWRNSGQSKREYCMSKGITEKQFYYYQRRIRLSIAEKAQQQVTTGENARTALPVMTAGNQSIVKLRYPVNADSVEPEVNLSINGIRLSVPENISEAFLAKLFEAASHGPF